MTDWPPEIEVGDLVFPAVISSPDVGEVLSITKNRRWAAVKWRSNGVRKRNCMDELILVNRALTEFNCRQRGQRPCPTCGYGIGAEDAERCRLCTPFARTTGAKPPRVTCDGGDQDGPPGQQHETRRRGHHG